MTAVLIVAEGTAGAVGSGAWMGLFFWYLILSLTGIWFGISILTGCTYRVGNKRYQTEKKKEKAGPKKPDEELRGCDRERRIWLFEYPIEGLLPKMNGHVTEQNEARKRNDL